MPPSEAMLVPEPYGSRLFLDTSEMLPPAPLSDLLLEGEAGQSKTPQSIWNQYKCGVGRRIQGKATGGNQSHTSVKCCGSGCHIFIKSKRIGTCFTEHVAYV